MKKTSLHGASVNGGNRIRFYILIISLPLAIGLVWCIAMVNARTGFREGWVNRCVVDTKHLDGSSKSSCECMYDSVEDTLNGQNFAQAYEANSSLSNDRNTAKCLKYT